MKKLIAVLLVVVIAATALSVTAFAYSDYDTGSYGGKTWNAWLSCSKLRVESSLSWDGMNTKAGKVIRVEQTTRYYNYMNNRYETSLNTGNSFTNVAARAFWSSSGHMEAQQATTVCKINGNTVTTLTARIGM